MDNFRKSWLFVLLSALLIGGAQANADFFHDDFNDGSTAGWTTQNGTVTESGGFFFGDNVSLATADGQAGLVVGVDAVADNDINYVALVLNYSSLSDNLFVKIQDNDNNGLFDRVFFYHGNNGSNGLVGDDFFDLSSQVASTFFQVTDNGDGTVSAFVGATGETFGGTLNNNYTGTDVGLGFFTIGTGNARGADSFWVGAAVPEPGSAALLGLGALGFCMLRSRRS